MEGEYFRLVRQVLSEGQDIHGRNGLTRCLFGERLRFGLRNSDDQPIIPLLTARQVFWRGVVAELLWFLSGDTNARTLQEQGVHIWDGNAPESGELGPIYGKQWRQWGTYEVVGEYADQLATAIRTLRENPDSRRIIVSAWNPAELDQMALPPCHVMFQFRSLPPRDPNGQDPRRRLFCQMYQRSCDLMLGAPFNIASYALLTHMVAQITNHRAEELTICLGDVHIYGDHLESARGLLELPTYPSPTLHLDPEITDIDLFRPEHIRLDGYRSGPRVKMEMIP